MALFELGKLKEKKNDFIVFLSKMVKDETETKLVIIHGINSSTIKIYRQW